MKALLTLLAGLILGGAALYTHPEWAGTVRHQLEQVTAPHAPASPGAPQQSGPVPSLAPVVVPPDGSPPASLAPQASGPPAPVATWSQADCQFATINLDNDARLDSAEAERIRSNGPDPRYPSATAAFYDNAAGEWRGDWLEALWECDHGRWYTQEPVASRPALGVAVGSCASQRQAFAVAIANHQGDEQVYPQNVEWDERWIAVYRQLDGLWAGACQDLAA